MIQININIFFNDSLDANYLSIIIYGNDFSEVYVDNEEKIVFITNTARFRFNLNTVEEININIENFDLNSKLINEYINSIKDIILGKYQNYIDVQAQLKFTGKNNFKPFKVSISSENGKVKKYFSKIIEDYLKTIEIFI